MFLQDLGQLAAERNRTDVVEEDRHDSAHQVQEPGDADQLTELHKNNTVGSGRQFFCSDQRDVALSLRKGLFLIRKELFADNSDRHSLTLQLE